MTTIDLSFIRSNPLYVVIAFLVFYYIIAKPFFDWSFLKSILIFLVLYILYKRFGNDMLSKFKKPSSSYGSRRR